MQSLPKSRTTCRYISQTTPRIPKLREKSKTTVGKFSSVAFINSIRYLLPSANSEQALTALKAYYEVKRTKSSSSVSLHMNSLSECYACLKKLLVRFILEQEFRVTIVLYRLLAEIAVFAKEYSKAIKYFTQTVSCLLMLVLRRRSLQSPQRTSGCL